MFNITEEQKNYLGVNDRRKDFYFKVENAVVDGYKGEIVNKKTGKKEIKQKSYFDNVVELAVYVVLSRYCNNGQIAYASLETLSIACCVSKPTLIKTIKSLEEKGFIKKLNRKYTGTNGHQTNLYSVQNINDIKIIERGCKKDLQEPCKEILQEVVKEFDIKKNKNKNNNIKENTTIKKKYNEQKMITKYNFLDLENFSKINNITKKNIRKNILNLTEEKAKEIYELTEKFLLDGKGKSFDAIFYKGLLGEWNFELNRRNLNDEIKENELSTDKVKWLNYFSGILSNKDLYNEIKNIIKDISIETLKLNKNKLSRMTIFEFKQYLYSIKKC